jgi:DNA-binding NarL/FixJ family response regulator
MGARAVWVDERNAIFRRGLVSSLVDADFEIAGESASLAPQPALCDTAILLFEADVLERALRLERQSDVRLVCIEPSVDGIERRGVPDARLSAILVRSEIDPASLVASLDVVLAGGAAISPGLLPRLLDAYVEDEDSTLASRELEVLRLLADGGDTRAIATDLSYSERTVKNIVHDVLVKLDCHTRAQAVAVASRRGLL